MHSPAKPRPHSPLRLTVLHLPDVPVPIRPRPKTPLNSLETLLAIAVLLLATAIVATGWVVTGRAEGADMSGALPGDSK